MDDPQPVAVPEEPLAVKGGHLLHTAVLLAGTGRPVSRRGLAGPVLARPAPGAYRDGQRDRVATHSTWWVIGKASKARRSSRRQPPPVNRARSRASVAGSQET